MRSSFILDQILSGETTEVVVERIHEYLTKLGNDVRGGHVPADKFIVHKVRKRCASANESDAEPRVRSSG